MNRFFRYLGAIVILAAAASACGGKVFVDPPAAGSGGSGAGLVGPSCESCSNKCVDLASDAQHCGACGSACTFSEVCQGGKCIATPCVIESCDSFCCGTACCGFEEVCCGNSDVGFVCVPSKSSACPTTACSGCLL